MRCGRVSAPVVRFCDLLCVLLGDVKPSGRGGFFELSERERWRVAAVVFCETLGALALAMRSSVSWRRARNASRRSFCALKYGSRSDCVSFFFRFRFW